MRRCGFTIRLLLLLTILGPGCSDAPSAATGLGPGDPAVPKAGPVERARLRLAMNAGERFPLRKVIEQQIVQSAAGQATETTTSRLETLLSITVEDSAERRPRFGVRYERVRFSREGVGERLEYDSAQPPVALRLELAAYQGMIGRGFSFWLDERNRIAGVEGFAAFVKDVLAKVPPESRDDVLLGVEAGTGEDGVADFVDDTIGLLPIEGSKAAGDTWRQTRRTARPVPMQFDALCTLRELTSELAVVDVRGNVTPLISTGVRTVAHESMHMVVERGTIVGECTLFRDTGLPKVSRIVQDVDLAVSLPGRPAVRQHKRMTTTVETYPAARNPPCY